MQLQNFALKFLLKGKKTSFYQNTTVIQATLYLPQDYTALEEWKGP